MAIVTCDKVGNALTEWLIDASEDDKDALCAKWPCNEKPIGWTTKTVDANYTVTAADHHVMLLVSGTGTISVNASNVPEGVEFSAAADTNATSDGLAEITGAVTVPAGGVYRANDAVFHGIGPAGGGPAIVLAGAAKVPN